MWVWHTLPLLVASCTYDSDKGRGFQVKRKMFHMFCRFFWRLHQTVNHDYYVYICVETTQLYVYVCNSVTREPAIQYYAFFLVISQHLMNHNQRNNYSVLCTFSVISQHLMNHYIFIKTPMYILGFCNREI